MKALIVSSSMRANSNSELLASQVALGLRQGGLEVEILSLKKKDIKFCIGCLSCQKTMKCVLKDDMAEMIDKVKESDIIILATPIYYYEMSGQLKTFLDRLNPIFPQEYKFREFYLLATAAEDEETTPVKAIEGVKGFVDCFEKVRFVNAFFVGGVTAPGEMKKNPKWDEAVEFGKQIAQSAIGQ